MLGLFFRAVRRASLAPLLAACAAAGCSGGPDVEPPPPPPAKGSTLAFDAGDGALTLAPGEVRAIGFTVDPPASVAVQLTLLGASLDASLSATTVTTDAGGHGQILLTGSSTAAAFRVRGSIDGGGGDELQVSVSAQGFGAVRALATYGGTREVSSWTASVVVGATCHDLSATLPADPPGSLSQSAPQPPVTVADVPVGPPLAVLLHGGASIWGCTNVPKIAVDGVTDVEVVVVDAPLDLGQVPLDVSLDATGLPLDALALAAEAPLLAALEDPDGARFAAAMSAALDDAGASADFEATWASGGWAPLGAASMTSLADAAHALVAAGVSGAGADVATFQLGTTVGDTAFAYASVGTFLGVPAADAGVPSLHLVTVSADPEDVLHLGGAFPWLPSRWAGALAAGAAGGPVELHAQLVAALGCASLAASVGSAGACDEACLALACEAAVDALWAEALDASASSEAAGSLSFTLTGAVTVSDLATPSDFQGTWVGSIGAAGVSLDAQGEAVGSASETPPPF